MEEKIQKMWGLFQESFSESFGIRKNPYDEAIEMLGTLKMEDLPADFVAYMHRVGADFLLDDLE